MLNVITHERRVSRHENTIRRAIWPPVMALGFLVAALLWLAYDFYDTARWVLHSSDLLYLGSRSLQLAGDMETSKRGYFLTKDESYLRLYSDAARTLRVDQPLTKLIAFTADNPEQQNRAKSLQREFTQWQDYSDKQLARFKKSPSPVFRALPPSSRQGTQRMDRMRTIYKEFMEEELRLKANRVQDSSHVAEAALLGGSAITLLVGSLLAVATRRQMRDVSDQYETVLESESRVRERLVTTLTSIGDGVLVTDATGRILLLNPVTESLTGWTNDEARGRPCGEVFDIVHEETGDVVPNPVDEVIRENRTVLLANHTILKRRDGTVIAIEDSAAPVRNKQGTVAGVVLVFRDVTERKKQEAELAAALAKNKRIAETLQRSMLTTPPSNGFPGLILSTLYVPASDEAQVGGDFFDTFTFWDDHVALVVGDATGKGLEAATTTSEVKYALRAYLHDNADPADALTRLNRFLTETQNRLRPDTVASQSLSFISVAIAIIDLKTGEGNCAVAGIDPPVLIRNQGGGVDEAAESGMMLGVSSDSTYRLGRFQLNEGDLIAFTTDGITEARRGKREFFGYEGFIGALRQTVTTPEQQSMDLDLVASSVVAQAKSFAGGVLKDDVCLLIARRSEP